MKIRLAHGLAYVEAALAFRGKTLHLDSVILDTGSASTLFASDRRLELGIVPEPSEPLKRIRGIGGVEFVFTKQIDRLAVGESPSSTSRSRSERWITASQIGRAHV